MIELSSRQSGLVTNWQSCRSFPFWYFLITIWCTTCAIIIANVQDFCLLHDKIFFCLIGTTNSHYLFCEDKIHWINRKLAEISIQLRSPFYKQSELLMVTLMNKSKTFFIGVGWRYTITWRIDHCLLLLQQHILEPTSFRTWCHSFDKNSKNLTVDKWSVHLCIKKRNFLKYLFCYG